VGNPSVNWDKRRDTSRSSDVVKPKPAVENRIDRSKTLKDRITFNTMERDTKGENRPRKEPKTNWEGKTYAQLTTGIPKETLDKRMEARRCARCDTEGHTVYMCRKEIKIGAIEVEDEMDYRESVQIGSDTTPSRGYIGEGYDSGGESVFH
jgi:hypothetical protein